MLSRAGPLPPRAKGMVTFELSFAEEAGNTGPHASPEMRFYPFTGGHWNPIYVLRTVLGIIL